MDETLIHTAKDDEVMPHRAPDFTFSLDVIGCSFDVYKRPGVHEFLKQVASEFEVAVWTAGTREYAEPILDWLDCDGVITHRLYRDSCTLHRYGFYVKDLSKLDRSLSEIIIVDNSAYSFAFHRDNGIQCTDYYFDEDDQELTRIGQFLCHIKDAKDFRVIVPQYHEWSPEVVNCGDVDFSDAPTVDAGDTDDQTSPSLGLIRWTDSNGNRRMRSNRTRKPPSRYGYI
jgi:RNA polymerase II subunit A small phosphatase-like protein